MRRETNLFSAIVAFHNLHRAFLGASHGKRDRPEVRQFEYHLESRLWEIRRELEAGAYQWGVFRRFWISDPKRREIRAAPFRDRVVHHVYLDTLDHFVKETLRVRHYIRYMDDFLLLAADRREARERLIAIQAFLSERLRLELNPRRVIVTPLAEPCDWLGYVHYSDGRRRVRQRSVRRLWRRLPALERRLAARVIDRDAARASLASWVGLAKHADAFRLSRRIFAERDVENIGKLLLVKSARGTLTISSCAT